MLMCLTYFVSFGGSIGGITWVTGSKSFLTQRRKDAKLQLDGQTFEAHDLQRIRRRTWSRTESIVKHHAAVEHFFAEVIVCHAFDLIRQLDQFQIVCCDQSHGSELR